jgi:hypothetical protein
MFILFILMVSQSQIGPQTVTVAEFSNKAKCEAAADAAYSQLQRFGHDTAMIWCAAK